ncbi:MAG TPA: hypothetical protein VMU87_18310 [Stellaceae bacterium]|nr:hypothetical protein [Stellaceae bacterium]
MAQQRMSYVDPSSIRDEPMLAEFDRGRREGRPRPESRAIRAHVLAAFWSFVAASDGVFRNGVMGHAIKERCRVYVSRSVKSARHGLVEDDYRDLLAFEKSSRYDERQKAALADTEAITRDLATDDALWQRLKRHFSEPQIVEFGYFVAATTGRQCWLRRHDVRAEKRDSAAE